jgi:hypothetical protein
MMGTAVDFAARLIDPQAIKDAGHSAVLVYVSQSRPGANFGAKPVTKEYADQCRAAGLDVVSIFQYGKPNGTAPSDWTTGYDGGYKMGLEARETHFGIGGPGACPIFFAVDENITVDQWNSGAVDFFRGVNAAIGKDWTGIYGSSTVCAWAIEDDVIGRTAEGKRWAWQTKAWSNGEMEPQAVLFQRVVDTASNPGPLIDGSRVDVNDILATDYGQWSIDRNAKVDTKVAPPEFQIIDDYGNSSSSRFGARVTNILFHTQEGNGTPESLAAYLNNPDNGASYHRTIGDGRVVNVVPLDRASWSVLDANSYTENICFAGSRASWSREEWLEIEDDIQIACWLAVQDCETLGIEPVVIAPPYDVRDGISDHKYVTQALGIGTHTDVGPNFPWDVVRYWVGQYASGAAPIAVVNEIDAKASVSGWLGARITVGENMTPDGEGRWAEFEHGYIYWHPRTGAHPIPKGIFGTWATKGWERGELGYPVTDHTELNSATGHGEVQGFENGAIYRRFGQGGFVIHGEIRNRWNASGFENGPLGWPTSDEIPFDGGAYQKFDNGTIFWPGTEKTITLLGYSGPEPK